MTESTARDTRTTEPTQDAASMIEALAGAKTAVLTTHQRPDPDGFGSALALMRWMSGKGVDCTFLIPGDYAPVLDALLIDGDKVATYCDEQHRQLVLESDLVVVVDVGLLYRLGDLEAPLKERSKPMAVIDHHLEINPVFQHIWVDRHRSSSGEMTALLLASTGEPLTPELANPLYMAISEDSGHFSFERTKPDTLRTAAMLVEAGADPYALHQTLNYQKDLGELKFVAQVTSTVQVHSGFPAAYAIVSQDQLEENGLSFDTMPGVANIPLGLKGVEMSLVFVELPCRQHTKVSIRSKGRLKVSEAAAIWGGGGHVFASGFTIEKPLEEAIAEGLEKVCAWYQGME